MAEQGEAAVRVDDTLARRTDRPLAGDNLRGVRGSLTPLTACRIKRLPYCRPFHDTGRPDVCVRMWRTVTSVGTPLASRICVAGSR